MPPIEPFERRSIEAALDLSGVRRIGELVPRLRPALALEPLPAAAGLGVHDEERGLFA